jgi:hypothetical protein
MPGLNRDEICQQASSKLVTEKEYDEDRSDKVSVHQMLQLLERIFLAFFFHLLLVGGGLLGSSAYNKKVKCKVDVDLDNRKTGQSSCKSENGVGVFGCSNNFGVVEMKNPV